MIAASGLQVLQASLQTPVVLVTVGGLLVYIAMVRSNRDKGLYKLGYLSNTTWPFFNHRFDFLRSAFGESGQDIVSFKVFYHSVVAMRGTALRKAFLENKTLDIIDGQDFLLGGNPRLGNLRVPGSDGLSWFNKQVLSILSKERNAEVLPTLYNDVQNRMEGWGREGIMDPFKELPNLVFQLTVRVASCRELATDMNAIAEFQREFSTLQESATPAALLLPWLPTTAKKNEQAANSRLRSMFRTYVEMRRESTTPNSDAIDFLLSRRLEVDRIVNCLLSLIWVSKFSTGIHVCWVLIFLASNVEWKRKVVAEVNAIMEKYTGNPAEVEHMHELFSDIPLSALEEEMPMLELVIRETLRLVVDSTLPRRNNHNDLEFLGKRISKGSFVIYQATDVHLNPDIYTKPTQFDPSRFGPGREEDRKEPYAFLGWGAGRHPCTGMKFGKLQIKIIVSLFLTAYRYDLVNENGGPLEHLPQPNHNDLEKNRPRESLNFKFERVVD